jgi:hypothetical protein
LSPKVIEEALQLMAKKENVPGTDKGLPEHASGHFNCVSIINDKPVPAYSCSARTGEAAGRPEDRYSLCTATFPNHKDIFGVEDCHKPGPLSPIGDGKPFQSEEKIGGIIGIKKDDFQIIDPTGKKRDPIIKDVV